MTSSAADVMTPPPAGDQERSSPGRASRKPAPQRTLRALPWLPLALSSIPVTMILLATRHGIGISADSVAYARAGTTLHDGGSLIFLDGSPFTFFPIGLPVLIAVLGAGTAMVGCNVLVAVAQVLVSHRLALVATGSTRTAAAVAAWVSVTISTVDIHAMLWSEPVFNLAANLAVLQIALIHARRRLTWATGVTLVASISVACLLRYVGCALLPFAAVVAFAALRRGRHRHAGWVTAAMALLAATGVLVTVIRNLTLGVGPFGPRGASTNSVPDVLFQVGTSTGNLVTNQAFAIGPLLSGIGWGVILVLGAGLVRTVRAGDVRGAVASPGFPVCAWLACYAAFICLSELTTSIDAIDLRISSPMQTPLFVALALAAHRLMSKRSRVLAPAALALLLASTLALSMAWTAVASQRGLGIERGSNGQVPWLATVSHLPRQAGIITNDPFPVAWLADRSRVAPDIDTFFFTTRSRDERIAALRSFVDHDGPTYVLAVGEDPTSVASPLRQAGFRLSLVEDAPAFTLYEVTG